MSRSSETESNNICSTACKVSDELVQIICNRKRKREEADAVFVQDVVLCDTHAVAFPLVQMQKHVEPHCRVRPVDFYHVGAAEEIDHTLEIVNVPNEKHVYVCYLLQSLVNPRQTYVGMTNNWAQRIRRHNGEIVGGARATKSNRPWRMIAIVHGFEKISALRFEWSWKHPKQRRLNTPWYGRAGRINCALQLLHGATWLYQNCSMPLVMYCVPEDDCTTCLSNADLDNFVLASNQE